MAGVSRTMSRTISQLKEALRSGSPLVCDGAWGTQLIRLGLPLGECPERWNLENPELVRSVARAYAEAGADIVETNSFGGSRLKLGDRGLAEQTTAINEMAARLSCEGAGPNCWVAGSIGPTGRLLLMEDTTETELAEVFGEQAEALVRGGAQAICVETMSAVDEASIAVRAARTRTDAVVFCTFVFEPTRQGDFRTMMGVTPEQAAEAALQAGADVIGANCGKGSAYMAEVIRRMRAAHPGVPILVQANAGVPQAASDGTAVFPETPEEMAERVVEWLEAGARLIGGCCGTTPEHIRAIRRAVDGHR